MAASATNLAARMPALNAPHLGRLVLVAGEAISISLGGGGRGRIQDVSLVGGFGMNAPRAVAGFTGFTLPAAPGVFFNRRVRVLLETLKDIIVAGLAVAGADIGRFCFVGGNSLRLGRAPQACCQQAQAGKQEAPE